MQQLSNSVGTNGTNLPHDSALVQAMLFASRRPAVFDPLQARYVSIIDGNFGAGSRTALQLYQNENVFVDPQSGRSIQVANATAGTVAPGDATSAAFARTVEGDFREVRALTGSKVPYIAATAATRDAAIQAARGEAFQATFLESVVTLINTMFDRHAIVLSVCRQGGRRTFQEQYALFTNGENVTNAGPGESNHNYGQAVDIGFSGLRWVRPDGTIQAGETSWLHRLTAQPQGAAKALVYWDELRNVGMHDPVNLHRGPAGDRPHLQAWNDAVVSMRRSLAEHLSRVSGMRWAVAPGGYRCDFGRGTMVSVGSAAQIWARSGPVGNDVLAAAGFGGPNPNTLAHITEVRNRLRGAFDTAETRWVEWRPA
ncbi:hypothetical protein [Novosphingobium resinovorum]|uniref:hypothetical protein n=1 Tax=Novosphingobium resinovorum TaxID=158500 RepID=UPI002ED4A596|nr:hypothetical protein [Novosphingobium resinovorum]